MSFSRLSLMLGLVLLILTSVAHGRSNNAVSLLPKPLQVDWESGSFTLEDTATVYADDALLNSITAVQQLLRPATGFEISQVSQASQATIQLRLDQALAAEAYRLHVSPQEIEIAASSNAGAYYALQTLRQLMPVEIYSSDRTVRSWTLPAVTIHDAPRFAWRGMHLDVGRHFMPVSFVKKYIDLLALHKMNRFHWHLTEDQGWRIEIKRYPRLTEVGSIRAQTVVGGSMFRDVDELIYDGQPHGGFYTQEEVREVVAYAAQRHITVVPEIEFPGHAQAAIAAYPRLGNFDHQLKVKEEWGISKNTLKPSPETLQFYRNVLTEVIQLFPGPYVHIGGDEAPKDQWAASEYAQQRIAELGLADENALQSWLIGQMDAFLTANNRTLIGWDEIMQGGLSDNAVVMSWRGEGPGLRAAEAGHQVIMAPTRWTYFDYYQADASVEPLAIGSYLPLRDVYRYDPAPASLPTPVRANILGAQGQVWTEYIPTPEHVEYMAYPRASALAEVLWSPQMARDFEDFSARLPLHLQRLDQLQVNYRAPGNDELTWRGWLRQGIWTPLIALYFWFIEL